MIDSQCWQNRVVCLKFIPLRVNMSLASVRILFFSLLGVYALLPVRDTFAQRVPLNMANSSTEILRLQTDTPRYGSMVRNSNQKHSSLYAFGTVPTTANAQVLVVAVQFAGQKATTPLSRVAHTYFSSSNSVAAYFRSVSYGQFKMKGNVVGAQGKSSQWMTLPHTEAYYANKDNGSGGPFPTNDDGIVSDVIAQLVKAQFNFSPYVYQGTISYLAIVYSGYGADVDPTDAGLIWPVESTLDTSISVPVYASSPVSAKVSTYDLAPELADPGGSPSSIGVYAHEFGHMLGLDDLYDTSGSANAGVGDGPFSLMGTGNWNGNPSGSSPSFLDPYSLLFLGWVQPKILNHSVTGNVLLPIEKSPSIDLIPAPQRQKEYLLLDNVEPIGYDAALPNQGLLIWHVDASQVNPNSPDWLNNVLNTPSQNVTKHDDLAIVGASGKNDLLAPANSGVSYDDAYPSMTGNNKLTASSQPSNMMYAGSSFGMDVRNIARHKNGTVTFDTIDWQQGEGLFIARPATGLTLYSGLPLQLNAFYGSSYKKSRDITVAGDWYASNDGIRVANGMVTTQSNRDQMVTVNVVYKSQLASINLQVAHVVTFHLSSPPSFASHFSRGPSVTVTAIYSNGVHVNVTKDIVWIKEISHARHSSGRSKTFGDGTYVGKFAGQTISL